MKKKTRKLLNVLLIFGLLINMSDAAGYAQEQEPEQANVYEANEDTQGAGASEETEDPENTVYNREELENWLISHREAGGSVLLGGSITIDDDIYIDTDPYMPHYTINTGQYGLTFDGGTIILEDFEIIGEGVNVPVVCIMSTDPYRSNWNIVACGLNITATGRGGVGGTALLVSQDDGSDFKERLKAEYGTIRSYGAGAVGVELAVSLDASRLTVAAYGEHSTAVFAPNGANLFYCKLTADGQGASVVSGSSLVLNTCLTVPAPKNATVINRRIHDSVGNALYYPVLQNIGPLKYMTPANVPFLLDEGDGYGVVRTFAVNWEDDPDNADISAVGQTVIKGHLSPFFQDFGIEGNFEIKLIVDVRSPAEPCIVYFDFVPVFDEYERIKDRELRLDYWNPLRGQEKLALIRSDDGGKAWADISASPEAIWDEYDDAVTIYPVEIDSPAMFRLDSVKSGVSNVITVNPYDIYSNDGIGGDRDGGDRIPITSKPFYDEPVEPEGKPKSSHQTANRNRVLSENSYDSKNSESEMITASLWNTPAHDLLKQMEDILNGSFSPLPAEKDADTDIQENIHTDYIAPDEVPVSDSETAENAAAEQTTVVLNDTGPFKEDGHAPPPQEWEDENTIVISGMRLSALVDTNTERVTFIKQGIRLSIEPDVLRELNISANQLLGIQIEKLPEHSFSVSFWSDDTEIRVFPFTVYIDKNVFTSLSLQSVICVDVHGETVASAYDPITERLAVFPIGSGVFTLIPFSPEPVILENENSEAQPHVHFDDLSDTQNTSAASEQRLLTALIAVTAGVVIFLLLKLFFLRGRGI